MKTAILTAFVCTFWVNQAAAQSVCRQALALGLDVSGSVDSREYRQQLEGLSAALMHPEVQQALFSMPGTYVTVAIYEWSGPQDQTVLADWTPIETPIALQAMAQTLISKTRAPSEQSTALGDAILYGASVLSQAGDCWTYTLDISGDGKSNVGPAPEDVRARIDDITINALVIGADPLDHGDNRQAQISELSAYFNAKVIHGPLSFVQVALGFDDYEAAMIKKLKREMSGMIVSHNHPFDQ